jgi:hypothetical protein
MCHEWGLLGFFMGTMRIWDNSFFIFFERGGKELHGDM